MVKRTIIFTLGIIASCPLVLVANASAQVLPGQVIDVVADNFFFRAPATARAGLTTFRLHSPHGGHEMQVIRLNGGRTVMDLVNALRADAPTPWARKLGAPGFPSPGGTTNTTFILEPGKYALLCYVRDRDGQRHYQKGMFTELNVLGGQRVRGNLPSPDIIVTMVDNAYHFSAPVTAGRHILRVANAGTGVHEFKIVRVLPGFTAAQSLAWKPNSGKPRPDENFASLTSIGPGVSVITTIDFPPGDYTVLCVLQIKHRMLQSLHVAPRNRGRDRRNVS